MVLGHASEHPSRWAAVTSIAAEIGCTPQTLHDWVKKAVGGQRAGVPTEMAEQLKALERENRELRQANEILRKASAYFATADFSTAGSAMIACIDDHRGAHGVEPDLQVLPITPSTYYAHVATRRDPTRLSARARQDAVLKDRGSARVR